MISKKNDTLVVILFSALLTGLFYKQAMGLNLVIAETIFFIWILFTKQFHFRGIYPITVGSGFIITSIATILTHSLFSYILNFLVLFIFIGLMIYPETKSLITTFGQAFSNIFNSQIKFLNELLASKLKSQKLGNYIWKFRIFIIPLFIIIVFVIIYRQSNPVFDKIVDKIGVFLQEKLSFVFSDFDFLIIITFMICLFVSIFIFVRKSNQRLIEIDKDSSENLSRRRKKEQINFRTNDLLNEYKAGVFLLGTLNLLLLLLNIIDIKWVWFSFEWEGQFLRQFVHQGTYLLILSIIISILLVFYFFRGNLNFYENNKRLKYLSYIWLAQNAILTISVAIRNFWYINYFALAYKRIGVILFLIVTLYGLYTVYIKVRQRKSTFFLFKANSYALLVLLIISSTINWDTIIAKYNFKHYHISFLHLDYVSTLSDKTLPHLDKTLAELNQIDKLQKEKFPFEHKFMTPDEYYRVIESRKRVFKEKWESESFLSWNLPEYLAYQNLVK